MTGTGPPPTQSDQDRDLPGRYVTGASAVALVGGIGIGGWETATGSHNPLGYTFAAFLVLMGFGMRRAANTLIARR